jgi:hypothetical protein
MNSLLLGICLLARVTFGGEPVASFAKQTLGLDLSSISFGTTAQTNDGYGMVDKVDAAGVSWMTNAASGKYNHAFPNRFLRYGFRDGKLVAVGVHIHSFIPEASPEIIDQRRKELVRIQDELYKAVKAGPGHQSNLADSSFRLQNSVMCSSTPESLFVMDIQITPVEKKKSP